MDQTNLLENIVKLNNKSRPNTKEGKAKKQNTFDSVNALYEGRELTLNIFRGGIFRRKKTRERTKYDSFASLGLNLHSEGLRPLGS